MHYRKILFVLLILATLPISSYALGLGVIFGEPTGISVALDKFKITAAWNLFNNNSFQLNGDYWIIDEELGKGVNWYLGVGARFFIGTGGNKTDPVTIIGLGLRVPVGLNYYIIPELEVFLEYVPGFNILPATAYDHDYGIGIRYHFK